MMGEVVRTRMAKLKPLKTLAVSLVNALLVASTLAWNVQSALAQTAALVPNAKQQFFNANGDPLVGGSVYSYVPNTTTPKTTWIDPFEATPNANPVVLDAGGGAFIFGQGNYRQVVKDAQGNLIWDGFTAAYGSSTPSGSNGTDTAPVGTVMPYAGSAVPVNWQLAYGQALSRTTFAQLETAITISTSTGNATSTSTTISGFANTSQVPVGSPIECSCLPTGTTVASITNATTLVVSQAATATGSFSVTVFPWGNGDGVSTFNVPDLRGRTFAGADAMGGTAASRLTTAFYGANASTPAVAGGAQSTTIAQNQLPNVSPSLVNGTLSGTPATITTNQSQVPTYNGTNLTTFQPAASSEATIEFASGGSNNPTIGALTANYTPAGSVSGTVAINGNQAQQALGVIQPTLTVNYIIKVAPNTTGAGGVTSLGGMFGDIVCASTLTCAPTGSPSVNTIGCTTATVSQLGCVRPDGTTVTIAAGVITAVTTVGQVTVGSTPVVGGTSNLPLIDVSGVLQQGTVSGNTTKFGTVSGALTSGHCVQADANGNLVDSGSTGCGGNTSTPVSQIFPAPGAVTTLSLTNTPLPTSAGTVTIFFDGREQIRSGWSINTGTGVITFTNAIPANVQNVEVDWFAPSIFAGISSITANATTLTGAVSILAGSNVTVSTSGQNIIVAAATGVGGSGTTNTLPLWIGSSTLGNSVFTQNSGATQAFIGTPVTVAGTVTATGIHSYADISQFGATPPVCNPSAPTSTNVAAAVVAAYNAGYRNFFFPDGCFAYTNDTAWVNKFGSNTIPNSTRWEGANWLTDGFSVCGNYTGCVPNTNEEISVGNLVETHFMFYNSWSCYNLDSQAFGIPTNCPIGHFQTGSLNGGNFSGYPFQPFNSYMTAGSWGGWNGTDSPQIGLTNNSTGDSIFIDNGSGSSGAHLLNLFGIGGTVGTWNADGKIAVGNSSSSHGSGMITLTDSFGSCGIFTNNTGGIGSACSSDRRLKKNIKPAGDQIAWLNSFHIRQYDMRSDDAHVAAGVVAQEVEQRHPEMVHHPLDSTLCDAKHYKDCLSVDAPDLWRMMKVMQEMQREIVALKHAAGRKH